MDYSILQNGFTAKEILSGNFGIEREGLRVDGSGKLATTLHPENLRDKISNPYITNDFSESQIEVITPTFKTVSDAYKFNNALFDIVTEELQDEFLWPQSMPCIIPDDRDIPIAKLDEEATEYRKMLLEKYGAKKQLISGIHYNFSFDDKFLKKLHKGSNKSFKEFKNDIYLKVARNYLRYRWLIIYLTGCTPFLHESYRNTCDCLLSPVKGDCFTNDGAISYRNGVCGYKNKVNLFPDYSSITNYTDSIKSYVNDDVITSHKELYSHVRLKPKNVSDFLNSLNEDGIQYLEYRSIDVNPFEKGGLGLIDLKFMSIFNIYLLLKEESDYNNWQEEALKNQYNISKDGLNNIFLIKDGDIILKENWALNILNEILELNKNLNLNCDEVINIMIDRVKHVQFTYAYKISQGVKKDGYVNYFMNLAKKYKEDAFNNRFSLEGYGDLELSTQILLKDSIKRGIKFDVLDRDENFVELVKNNKVEYVKQATKTSKDSYSTVLLMEDKFVTKKMLDKNNIKTPTGEMFNSYEDAISEIDSYIGKGLVIKPKSTNFGEGISIFPSGGNYDDLEKAIKIAFEYDNAILVEEFITGIEYRFLVINDKVEGILRRVPANVTGNGVNSIEELVEIKNRDSLRGYKYKKPLEKVQLDDIAVSFIKKQGLDVDYVPKENETVFLRENSNISTGGDSIDYTDDMPDRFKAIAVDAAKAVNAKICGVDMMIDNYEDENSKYAIIELNFNPAIHIHCFPYKGRERKIGGKVLDLLELV